MNKDKEAVLAEFERLVMERQDWLFRFAYMRVGRREEAEDIVQEALLMVFRRMRQGGAVSRMEPYLLRSISNACHDYFRQGRPATVPLEGVEQLAAEGQDATMHEEYVRINRLLGCLPPEQAEIVRLRCYDELKFGEIAELQNVSESTVKSRYRYAIERLQKIVRKGE